MTYAELNERANRLAHYLRALGVGPEVCVAICLERSLDLVVGLLGILKAGGAYLPLDPAYPAERLQFMIDDAKVGVLLTEKSIYDLRFTIYDLPANQAQTQELKTQNSKLKTAPLHLVTLSDAWSAIARCAADDPVDAPDPANLAYVIYTSGSTGTPKGAMNTHRAIVNRLCWMQDAYRLDASDRVLQKTPISFDVSVWEFFWPLIAGASLVLARPGGHQDGDYLAELIAQQQITTLHFVPTMLQAFLASPDLAGCGCLRRVICSGETLVYEVQERSFARLAAALHNLYGPTEAAVDVTAWACEREGPRQSVPIGRPIANTQIYLLDPHMRPVPVGVPGELHIGGVQLARGYLGRPDLTAERFVPNPFAIGDWGLGTGAWGNDRSPNPQSLIPNPRLYKTGDLARWRADGVLEFLGRLDAQVKLRGFRIELGEIEVLLGRHPAVREAVVVAREDQPGAKQLVAYVVPKQEPRTKNQEPRARATDGSWFSVLGSEELRTFLQAKLPPYMVPAAFVILEALPVTPNGKIDRRALPAPGRERSDGDPTFVAPRTPTEELLASIWAQVLGVERVGVHDNFFEIGGDSILSMQITARARQTGLEFSPMHIFDHPTIAELAPVAVAAPTLQADQGPLTGHVPLTPIQRWFFEQALSNPHRWNQAVLLETRHDLDLALLGRVFRYVFAHHDALRLRFEPRSSLWRQFYAGADAPFALTTIDLADLPEGERARAIESLADELQASLDLTTGPLVRAAFFDLGADRAGRLLLIAHHLVIDGISWRVLLEDLQVVYRQLSRGEAMRLPAKTTSFKRWAELLADYARSAQLREDAAYWLAARDALVRRLPLDQAAGANSESCARTLSVTLDAVATRALLHEVPRACCTRIDDVLLTALAQAFAQWTGVRALLIDLEGHGREEIVEGVDLSRTVGWFTTLFPVWLDLSGCETPGDALKSVKEQLRALSRQGIAYGVMRYLGAHTEAAASLRALPQAEVLFNYLGQADQILEADGLFQPARESFGVTRDPRNDRRYLLEINAIIAGGQLRVSWTYSSAIHREATIKRLSQQFVDSLTSLIQHCRSHTAAATPRDFPLAGLDQEKLDAVIAKFKGKKRR